MKANGIPTEQLLIDIKDEIHAMNSNIVKLIERDKVQNKRIDDIEKYVKELTEKVQNNKENIYKIMSVISFLTFVIPIIMRFIN